MVSQVKKELKLIGRRIIPDSIHRRLKVIWEWYRRGTPPVGWVRFGSLRRLQPIAKAFGIPRGQGLDQCIDRYYIEKFLAQYATDIQGQVLEIADNAYTRRFGGERVLQSDILHAAPGNPQATIIADIEGAASGRTRLS